MDVASDGGWSRSRGRHNEWQISGEIGTRVQRYELGTNWKVAEHLTINMQYLYDGDMDMDMKRTGGIAS